MNTSVYARRPLSRRPTVLTGPVRSIWLGMALLSKFLVTWFRDVEARKTVLVTESTAGIVRAIAKTLWTMRNFIWLTSAGSDRLRLARMFHKLP